MTEIGEEAADSGRVLIPNGTAVTYLSQNPPFNPDSTVLEAVLEAKNETLKLILEYEKICLQNERMPTEAMIEKMTVLSEQTPTTKNPNRFTPNWKPLKKIRIRYEPMGGTGRVGVSKEKPHEIKPENVNQINNIKRYAKHDKKVIHRHAHQCMARRANQPGGILHARRLQRSEQHRHYRAQYGFRHGDTRKFMALSKRHLPQRRNRKKHN